MPEVTLRLASEADRPVVERLWQLFRHDMSEFHRSPPSPDGTFRSERVEAAFTDPGRAPYLLMLGDRPAGLAIVRGLETGTRVLNAFFVVRGARRSGLGLRAARQVFTRHPGRWEIPFQDVNLPAVSFWRRVATEAAGESWTETRGPTPGQPDLPPDVWIAFDVPEA